jgi:DNA-binding response OmpR family regulator
MARQLTPERVHLPGAVIERHGGALWGIGWASDLTPTERRILWALAGVRPRGLDNQALATLVWGASAWLGPPTEHALRVHISRIRQRLPVGIRIEAVRWEGRRLVVDGEDEEEVVRDGA